MLDHIPLFPLNTILFPGMPLELQIFEKRYTVMMKQVLSSEPVFGVVLIRRGVESLGPLAEPYMIGTLARIIEVEQLEGGKMNITIVGENRFQINEIFKDEPFLTGNISEFPLEYKRPLDVLRRIRPLRNHVHYYLQTIDKLNENPMDLNLIEMPEDPISFLFLAASLLQIPSHEKFPILSSQTALGVCMAVERLYRRENAVMRSLIQTSDEEARNIALLN
jgi:ATP-dependent Lon protease